MSDIAWFAIVFVGFFVLRALAATRLFLYLLPRGSRCPNCDEATIRIHAKWWNRFLPWVRTSWCYRCGWEGLLGNEQQEASKRAPAYSERHQ